MSTLKVDTVVGLNGTSPVTLTKQSAAKHFITYNETQVVTSSLNNSSITDVGSGNHRYNFVNNFNTAEGYTCGGVMAWITDQTTNVYYYNCSTSHGDLA